MSNKQTSSSRKVPAALSRRPIGGIDAVRPTEEVLDALTLLRSDHETVAELFEDFDAASEDEKQDIAVDICGALTIHAKIEEEIFYPAAREVLQEEDAELVNEADVEHGAVRQLVAQIEAMDGDDHHFAAMVTVLGEYVKHHVEEEENELFPKLQETELDLVALGQRLAARKAELSAE
jgi:hemerythrin-like domain-containing protein